ncbi:MULTISPECIES: hypothetical protein [Pseudomonas]|uniref:hypothetical protein n=1 Tax=Pseudomonas TaxID=286 RepID=UPI0030017772
MTKINDPKLKASEIERFDRNLENFAKLTPDLALYHRFQGILESQIATLQCVGLLTSQGAVKLHEKMAVIMRETKGKTSQ